LWASSAAGTLAGRHADSTWELAVPDPGISFTDISDAACDVEGTLWMATEDGLLKGTLGVPFPVFAPIVQKP
jgi:ligand-binding sensor domain-containing protein